MFNQSSHIYQEALNKSGYSYQLKFKPQDPKPAPKNEKRKRDVTWFNPPFNCTVKTNIGREFLKLVDECFPPQNPLSKIFNRQTIKISYSGSPNMEKIQCKCKNTERRGNPKKVLQLYTKLNLSPKWAMFGKGPSVSRQNYPKQPENNQLHWPDFN